MRKIIISAIVIILGIVLLGNISFADTKQQILAKYELEKTAK
jgi:hypothetical protein